MYSLGAEKQENKTGENKYEPDLEMMMKPLRDDQSCQATLKTSPVGEKDLTDDDLLDTSDFDDIVVGSTAEIAELRQLKEVAHRLEHEQQDCAQTTKTINAAIFFGAKFAVTIFLTVIAGPIIALVLGIVMAAVKFVVSWICYPVLKINTILCKALRENIKISLMPVEPMIELLSRCFPRVFFSFNSYRGGGTNDGREEHDEPGATEAI